MSRPLVSSKVSVVKDQKKIDRLSSLPDDVLVYILSFLSTKSAVGTSIMSSRWRYLHTLTNCLSFEAPYVHCPTEREAKKKAFKKFVYRVLLNHKVSPIKKFSLNCGLPIYDDLDLHAWISAAILKGVEQLELSFKGQLNALPDCLFSCQNIVELKLCLIHEIQVPESAHLPNLKILHLYIIKFLDRDSFCEFFFACPSLQELEIVHCEWPMDSDSRLCLSSRELRRLKICHCKDQFHFDAPNLAYLHYNNEYRDAALSLGNTDRLVTAILELEFPFDNDPNSIELALALIKAISHVKELQLLENALLYITHFEDDQIPSYPNLVKLHLGLCMYDNWKYVTHWLANSPQLETLIFEESLINGVSREDEWPSDVALVPFSSPIKVIEASEFRGYKTELALLKYLLGNAELLQGLTLYKHRYNFQKERELQVYNELSMLPRASGTCAIHLRDKRQ